MESKNNESGFAHVALIVALASILVLGSYGVVGAANGAKPGDTLYGIDTGIEGVRLALASDPQTQVDLRTQFAAERLGEARQLLLEQGAGAPGIDAALANASTHRTEIDTLIAQNQDLQAKIDALESQLELQQQLRALEDSFQTAGENIENQLQTAKESGNDEEAERLENELDELESKKEALDDEDEEESEEAEPEEEDESEESSEDSEDGESSEEDEN